eukprot:m.153264 g.153264  ORF g.153264 m.153264 type:complete len:213 (-) comp17910_c0_seq7:1277-1915(-)
MNSTHGVFGVFVYACGCMWACRRCSKKGLFCNSKVSLPLPPGSACTLHDALFFPRNARYRQFVVQYLRGWLALLCISTVLWLYMRYRLSRLLHHINHVKMDEVELSRNPDTQLRVLKLQKEGLNEVTKPLEPYVVVFIVFSIPAIAMATDQCVRASEGLGNIAFCDTACEFALAFRSLASVAAYFNVAEHRHQFTNGALSFWACIKHAAFLI